MKNSEKNTFLGLVMGLSIIATMFFVGMSYAQTGNINETADSSLTNTSSTGNEGAISITVPVEKGYVNGNISYFISTDASEEMIVSSVSNTTKFKVNYAPTLSNTSEISRQQGYVFINGILGNGTFEHQLPVASASGGDLGYSPLFEINYVKWNNDSQPRVLKSAGEILDAESKGELSIEKSNIVINSPAVEVKQ
ncbi:MAG TPA: hypothetical protein VJR94_10540 [Candidatus Nitrosocosmicus sp.]|nr:hypothetical protein [Candidatus Nitrosocosmicus sp.]